MHWQDFKVSMCQDRRRVCHAPSGPGRFSAGKGLGQNYLSCSALVAFPVHYSVIDLELLNFSNTLRTFAHFDFTSKIHKRCDRI